ESLKDPLAPPTLVVMPHLGSWELLGQAISLHGVRAAAVAHPLRNPLVDRMLTRARAAHGLQIIPSDGAVRGISRAVREGRHIGILVDQNTRPGEGGIFVRFFGLPVTVSRGPAVLARRLGLRVLVAACLRQEGGFRMRSLELARPVSVYGTEEALMQAIIEANEGLIRGCPEQYLWTYRRWRYLPAGLDPERASAFPFYAQPYVQRPRKRRRART
ncbi:MAG: lysophospholipid acyltransferase family protein, partial [Lentisphaeria bacterium]|nr:lysophospholipid acyltransferase family protein [Lentisphaeria bacterium]